MTMTAPPEYPIAFVPGVGHLEYWCGVSESIYQITTHLQNRPLVIANGAHGLARRLQQESRPVAVADFGLDLYGFRRATLLRKARVAAAYLRYAYTLFRLFRRHRVRVVYTANVSSVLSMLPAKMAGARLVIGVRGSNGRVRQWKWAFRACDRAAVLSRQMADAVCREFEDRPISNLQSKLRVIYNGVDLAAVPDRSRGSDGIRASVGMTQQGVLVLYAAAFRSWKGQLRFIEEVIPACGSVPERREPLHFVFAGSATEERDRDYERACHEAARRSEFRGFIHFAGFQPNIWPWYAAADVVALASEHEGMPRAVIEAMSCATAVICYDVCSARELLEETGAGVVVPQGDAAGMAAAINHLAREARLRARMGARGLSFAMANLDIHQIAAAYDRLFAELM